MQISAKLVKELRDKTGAGMMDCKRALQETNGDIEKAIDYLREKGMATALKKQSRIAAEGLLNVIVKNNEALIYELNSETDFVAKNKQFLDLLTIIGDVLIDSNVENTEEALKVVHDGKTVEQILVDGTALIGEKLTLRNVLRFFKDDNQGFGFYKHMGGRIVSLVKLDVDSEEVAKDVAMHVAAQNPQFLDQSQVDAETLAKEKHILTEQALAEGKPANIVEKMVIGRLNKYLKDICLVDQMFIKDTDMTVGQYVKNNKVNILSYVRLEIGEGIEKREEDFAAEVQAQLQNK